MRSWPDDAGLTWRCGVDLTMRGWPASRGVVDREWRSHETARRRSGIKCRIIHHKVHHSDGPSWAKRSSREWTDTRRSTLDTDPEGCQTIQNQCPGITTYPNHVMYFSRPIGNYRPYVLLVFVTQIIYSSINHTIQIPIMQMKDHCLPVAYYCFSSQYSFLHGRLQYCY